MVHDCGSVFSSIALDLVEEPLPQPNIVKVLLFPMTLATGLRTTETTDVVGADVACDRVGSKVGFLEGALLGS